MSQHEKGKEHLVLKLHILLRIRLIKVYTSKLVHNKKIDYSWRLDNGRQTVYHVGSGKILLRGPFPTVTLDHRENCISLLLQTIRKNYVCTSYSFHGSFLKSSDSTVLEKVFPLKTACSSDDLKSSCFGNYSCGFLKTLENKKECVPGIDW